MAIDKVPVSDERVYFQSSDFLVTSKIIKSKGRVFNPSMINSVKFTRISNPQSFIFSNRITAFSVLAIFIGIADAITIAVSVNQGFSKTSWITAFLLTSIFVFFLWLATVAARRKSSLEPYGWIGFEVSSGDSIELIRTTLAEAEQINEALVNMIRDKNV